MTRSVPPVSRNSTASVSCQLSPSAPVEASTGVESGALVTTGAVSIGTAFTVIGDVAVPDAATATMLWSPACVAVGMVADTVKAPDASAVVVAILTGSDWSSMVTASLGSNPVP